MRFFRLQSVLRAVALLLLAGVPAAADSWYADTGSGERRVVAPAPDGAASLVVADTGTVLLYRERERRTFRPAPEDFAVGELAVEARLKSDGGPVRAWIFVKDKDGFFFRAEPDIELTDTFRTWRVRLDEPGRHWLPVGHRSSWHAGYAAGIFAAGIGVSGDGQNPIEVECRPPRREGVRAIPELAILDWELPESGTRYTMLESTFRLTREYFNPFDPAEIEVDYEFIGPDGAVRRHPAFFTQKFHRSLHLTREVLSPVGEPYWAFRLTPPAAGDYRVRLRIADHTPGRETRLVSPWRSFRAADSAGRGGIRRAKRNPAYFEFDNGEFYYPVGLNIHTNIDVRSEFRFEFGHLPDRGTYDYDEYFRACGRAGINAVEVWMASWTCAIEWDAARAFYHGLGRYNLANAWKLDHMLKTAGENGIYLNLILDNHGKTAMNSDQEWNDNPFNSQARFAVANGGFLADAADFFSDPLVRRYNAQRNRYLAARWGADPRIMAVELWSEVNLVSGIRETTYEDGSAVRWHREVAAEFTRQSQFPHLITTHVSGDWKTSLRFRDLFEIPEHTHWAGDAYRNNSIHMVDQMRAQEANMRFPKPVLITEFGGASLGGERGMILADIHAGIWSSLFKRQAGTPFLWWHDFVHVFDHYRHYRGFADFLQGIDLRDPGFRIAEPETAFFDPHRPVLRKRPGEPELPEFAARPPDCGDFLAPARPRGLPRLFPPRPEARYESLSTGTDQLVYGWTFNRAAMFVYPDDAAEYPPAAGLAVRLDHWLRPGRYRAAFFDTVSGKRIAAAEFHHAGGPLQLPLPAFRLDVAYRITPIEVSR